MFDRVSNEYDSVVCLWDIKVCYVFFLMIRRPPRSTRTDTLFPYTTLFRSWQGLNLGLRDVAALTEVLVEGARLGLDLGDAALLARYQRWRGLDNMMVSLATDGLTRLFGIPGRTAAAIRHTGLGAVQHMPTLKRFFMDEARGEAGALPRLRAGTTRQRVGE